MSLSTETTFRAKVQVQQNLTNTIETLDLAQGNKIDNDQQMIEEINRIKHLEDSFNYDNLTSDSIHSVKQQSPTSKVFPNYALSCLLADYPHLHENAKQLMEERFDGYYPIVIDIETGGLDKNSHPILQIGAVALSFNKEGKMIPYSECKINLHPTRDTTCHPHSLAIHGINPYDLQRKAVAPALALTALCKFVRQAQRAHGCRRSLIVGHNVSFDAQFIHTYIEKYKVKRSPFHPFVNFDTTSIAGLLTGSTKLLEAVQRLGITYDSEQAHDALYDAYITAQLFCKSTNLLQSLNLAIHQQEI